MSGNDLRSLLKYHNVVIKELAEKLGMSQQRFDQRLNNKTVKVDFLKSVQDALGFELTAPSVANSSPLPEDSTSVLIKMIQEELKLKNEKLRQWEEKYEDLNKRYQELLSAVEYKKQSIG